MKATKFLILLIMFVASATADDHIELEQNFRHIGTIATGLSYAHIHGTIDFAKLKIAYQSVIHFAAERKKVTQSNSEKAFIDALQPQLDVATGTLEDIENLFFPKGTSQHDIEKRQIFLGITIALGLASSGMSIYNTAEITKLHGALTNVRTDMTDGFRHVAHILKEEDHAVHRLTTNVQVLKKTCRYILEKIENEVDERISMVHMLQLTALINNLNAELFAWGRGLDALSQGRLHPTLINPEKLRIGFQQAVEKAKKFGLRPIHTEMSDIYKNPISYLATKELQIIVIVHIPLIGQEPLNLFEHLAIPTKMDDIFITVEGRKNILASDLQGQQGLELEELDLLRCQTEDRKNGKLFICPNTNLVKNNIRKSCLGALFYGHQKEVMEHCDYYPHTLEGKEEFAKQIAVDRIIYFTRANVTVLEACPTQIRTLANITGLTTITVAPGCRLMTENYIFKSPIIIDQNSDFIKRKIRIPRISLLPKNETEDIKTHLEALKKLKNPNKVHLAELNQWIQKMDKENTQQAIGFSLHLLTLTLGIFLLCAFVFLYICYRKARKSTSSSSSQ